MNLEELRQKPDSTKRKIIIGVAIVLILILGALWVRNTQRTIKEIQREDVNMELPDFK